MERRMTGGTQALAQSAEAERNRLLAGSGGATGGASLLSAQLGEEQRQMQQERIDTEILAADEARKQQQIQEMRGLEAEVADRRARAVAAGGAILGAGLEAGLNTKAGLELQNLRKPTRDQAFALAKTFDISEQEAYGILELSSTNPEALSLFSVLKGGKK